MVKFLFFLLLFISKNSYSQIQAVGDFMLGHEDKFYNSLLQPVNKIFNDKNYINVINLEGVITEQEKSFKCQNQTNNCFAFKQKKTIIPHLLKNNIKIVNLANNHISDFGLNGIIETNKELETNNILSIGLPENNFKEYIFKNKKYVFFGLSPHNNTQSIWELDLIKEKIKNYKKNNYIVVASVHIGAEGNDKYLIKNENEIYLGQNRGNVYKLSRELIDYGVDVFLGHGPHVLRPIDLYKNKLIVYSLGNFITYGNFSLKDNLALGGILRLNLEDNGDFKNAFFIGTEQTKSNNKNLWNNGHAIISSNKSYNFLKDITNNFNKNNFIFNNNGEIIKKN